MDLNTNVSSVAMDSGLDFVIEYIQSVIKRLPDLNVKKDWERVHNEMCIHIDGKFPECLIKNRRPYEDDIRHEFRQKNFEPITMGAIHEAIDGLHRIFNEKFYEIELSKDLEAYIFGNNFYGTDYISYIRGTVMLNMIRDPNGWLVVLPSGKGLVDNKVKVDPYIEFVPSCNIIDLHKEYICYISSERSVVKYYNREVEDGNVFYFITKTTYYKITQYGNKSENSYEVVKLYPHYINEIPYVILGGNWVESGDYGGYYNSFFSPFIPFGNECLRQYSDWQGVLITCAYPIREIRHIACRNKECQGGYIMGTGNRCFRCNGTGVEIAMSPYGVFETEELAPGQVADTSPPIRFHSPPTDIIEYSENAWRNQYKDARAALHLDFIQESQSGAAKAIDREREYSMLLKISNHVYDVIIYNTLFFMEKLRNLSEFKTPQVIKPSDFMLKSESDLLQELAQMKQYNAPVAMIKEVMLEILRKRYHGNDIILQKNIILMEIDCLYFLTTEEKVSLKSIGVVSDYDIGLSLYAPKIMDRIIREYEDNYKELMDTDKIIAEIKKIYESEYYNPKIEKQKENYDTYNISNQLSSMVSNEVGESTGE